jgi:pectinesterase
VNIVGGETGGMGGTGLAAHAGSSPGEAGGAGGATGGSDGAGGTFSSCTTLNPRATIYTIGDSTMSVYDSKAYPRMGWAQPLGDLVTPSCARVVDKALSGRSSKSFFDEGAWTPVKDALKAGDFVLIQFGHNDEKSDNPTLYTEPQTTYKQYLTGYVNDTRAKQATPILLTSINRNSWSGATLNDTHGAYPPAVRELAQALDVTLIDLEKLTRGYFERIGQSETAKLFLILQAGQYPNYPNGVTDNTHLQEQGARKIGQLAMADTYARRLPIAELLKGMPVAP